VTKLEKLDYAVELAHKLKSHLYEMYPETAAEVEAKMEAMRKSGELDDIRRKLEAGEIES